MSTDPDNKVPGEDASVASRRQLKKMETQQSLLQAARDLFAEGGKLTIAAAADRAGISVATAYRYYSDPDKMRRDAALNDKFGPDPEDFLTRFEAQCSEVCDPLERVLVAQRMMFDFVVETENEYRMFIASSHEHLIREAEEGGRVPSGGRRILLLEAALTPLKDRLSEDEFCELVYRLMLVSGPEPYFVLRDFTSHPTDEIWRLNEAAIRSIYRDFLAERS